jgi:hypothetical protein
MFEGSSAVCKVLSQTSRSDLSAKQEAQSHAPGDLDLRHCDFKPFIVCLICSAILPNFEVGPFGFVDIQEFVDMLI